MSLHDASHTLFCYYFVSVIHNLVSLGLAKTPFETLHLHELLKLELFSCHDNSLHCQKFINVKTRTYYFKACVGLTGGLCSLNALLVIRYIRDVT